MRRRHRHGRRSISDRKCGSARRLGSGVIGDRGRKGNHGSTCSSDLSGCKRRGILRRERRARWRLESRRRRRRGQFRRRSEGLPSGAMRELVRRPGFRRRVRGAAARVATCEAGIAAREGVTEAAVEARSGERTKNQSVFRKTIALQVNHRGTERSRGISRCARCLRGSKRVFRSGQRLWTLFNML